MFKSGKGRQNAYGADDSARGHQQQMPVPNITFPHLRRAASNNGNYQAAYSPYSQPTGGQGGYSNSQVPFQGGISNRVHPLAESPQGVRSSPGFASTGGYLDKHDDEMQWLRHADMKPKLRHKRKNLAGPDYLGFKAFMDLFYIENTIYVRAFTPATVSAGLAAVWTFVNRQNFFLNIEGICPDNFYLPMCYVTLLLLCFRLGLAVRSFLRGNEIIRKITKGITDSMMLCVTCPNVRKGTLDINELCRKLNLLMAFIRQDLRESRVHPKSKYVYQSGGSRDIEAVEQFYITPVQFAEDPHGAPPLHALLTHEELDYYSNFKPTDRVNILLAEICAYFSDNVNYGSQRMTTPTGKIFMMGMREINDSWIQAKHIIKVPIPFTLHHTVILALFTFCAVVSPLYFGSTTTSWMAVPASFFLSFFFYGIELIATEIEVPFGWRANDVSLTSSCRFVLKASATYMKTHQLWKLQGMSAEATVPAHAPLHPGEIPHQEPHPSSPSHHQEPHPSSPSHHQHPHVEETRGEHQ